MCRTTIYMADRYPLLPFSFNYGMSYISNKMIFNKKIYISIKSLCRSWFLRMKQVFWLKRKACKAQWMVFAGWQTRLYVWSGLGVCRPSRKADTSLFKRMGKDGKKKLTCCNLMSWRHRQIDRFLSMMVELVPSLRR